jgi:hypothetical protein
MSAVRRLKLSTSASVNSKARVIKLNLHLIFDSIAAAMFHASLEYPCILNFFAEHEFKCKNSNCN